MCIEGARGAGVELDHLAERRARAWWPCSRAPTTGPPTWATACPTPWAGWRRRAGLLAFHPAIATPDEGRPDDPDDPDGLRAGLREHWEKQRRIVLATAAATG
ncbi:hypothetical protein J5Y04_15835 [Kitasatospora sp. RG8]|uniref:hypothetical protein n=1 Tax=Kitasatospora sp. RG8 TaxID=2820815 RepID=UPI001ADFC8B9|nr:hypothetical protein [Kitasatospora sp. RG8]MBP0451004.1 hypothetical protein [Kitasatospora sp. RG8]